MRTCGSCKSGSRTPRLWLFGTLRHPQEPSQTAIKQSGAMHWPGSLDMARRNRVVRRIEVEPVSLRLQPIRRRYE